MDITSILITVADLIVYGLLIALLCGLQIEIEK